MLRIIETLFLDCYTFIEIFNIIVRVMLNIIGTDSGKHAYTYNEKNTTYNGIETPD